MPPMFVKAPLLAGLSGSLKSCFKKFILQAPSKIHSSTCNQIARLCQLFDLLERPLFCSLFAYSIAFLIDLVAVMISELHFVRTSMMTFAYMTKSRFVSFKVILPRSGLDYHEPLWNLIAFSSFVKDHFLMRLQKVCLDQHLSSIFTVAGILLCSGVGSQQSQPYFWRHLGVVVPINLTMVYVQCHPQRLSSGVEGHDLQALKWHKPSTLYCPTNHYCSCRDELLASFLFLFTLKFNSNF